jgi:hypothetical protein
MKTNTRRWYHLVGPVVGVLVMLAGLRIAKGQGWTPDDDRANGSAR